MHVDVLKKIKDDSTLPTSFFILVEGNYSSEFPEVSGDKYTHTVVDQLIALKASGPPGFLAFL